MAEHGIRDTVMNPQPKITPTRIKRNYQRPISYKLPSSIQREERRRPKYLLQDKTFKFSRETTYVPEKVSMESVTETAKRRRELFYGKRSVVHKFSSAKKQVFGSDNDIKKFKKQKRVELEEHFSHLNQRYNYFGTVMRNKKNEISLMKKMIKTRKEINQKKEESRRRLEGVRKRQESDRLSLQQRMKERRDESQRAKSFKMSQILESRRAIVSQTRRQKSKNLKMIQRNRKKILRRNRKKFEAIKEMESSVHTSKINNLRSLLENVSLRISQETNQEVNLINKKTHEVEQFIEKEKELASQLDQANKRHMEIQKRVSQIFGFEDDPVTARKIEKRNNFIKKYHQKTEIMKKEAKEYLRREKEEDAITKLDLCKTKDDRERTINEFFGRAESKRSLKKTLTKFGSASANQLLKVKRRRKVKERIERRVKNGKVNLARKGQKTIA